MPFYKPPTASPGSANSADTIVGKALRRMIARMERNLDARADLLQEALVHIWSRERQCPGQRVGWYLQSAKFHLHHHRVSGRSLDSPKRRSARAALGDNSDNPDQLRDAIGTDDGSMSQINARDIRSLLIDVLEPMDMSILLALDEGWSSREVAKRFEISHESVRRHRRKIADAALKLGIVPLMQPP